MDCADLVEVIADMTKHCEKPTDAKEQFRAQLIRVIDERVAIAMEKRLSSQAGEPVKQVLGDIQTMLHGIEAAIVSPLDYDAPTGMSGPRS